MKAAFSLAVFTDRARLCRPVVPPLPQPSALARSITPRFHGRTLADAFVRCDAICGGCEQEPVSRTPRRHEPRTHERPFDK